MTRRAPNRIRIIGGTHRGRRLSFPDAAGLRPTPDRVRETLFNWLMPHLPGARCLDPFAGSGALGLEAASRGAREVVLVDTHPAVVKALQENLRLLDETERARVIRSDALAFLRGQADAPFDIVFLDPPYAADRLPEAIRLLEEGGWLADPAWIYIEAPVARGQAALPPLPANWSLQREKRAGQVGYHLVRRVSPASTSDR